MNIHLSKILIFVTFLLTAYLHPQQSKLSKSVNHISAYIASGEFISLRSNMDDINIVDSIYSRAVKQTDYDYSEALLSLTFSTVPYKEVPIQIPLLKIILNYPLISASDSIYNLKNENLPRYIFFDTPNNNYGDKDKLAHFFGSAFISFSSNIFDLGKAIGYFVEVVEESFKVQSSIDQRDLNANKIGNIFGTLLKENKKILPSQVIILGTLSHLKYNL